MTTDEHLPAQHLQVADLPATSDLLQRWALEHYGRGAVVERVRPMPGHAGISFGFDVAADGVAEALVIRVAPPGVRRVGPADVLHQVPVLRAAREAGVPVAAVRWWSDDERWFGSPYFVVECLRGASLDCWEPLALPGEHIGAVFDQAIAALAAIHRIDWRRALPGWSASRSLVEQVTAWTVTLEKGGNPAWTAHAASLRDLLLSEVPPEPEPTVVHGDFYSNNWVCAEGVLSGVVDWEIATVGAPLLDLAWLMMVYDPACWGPTRRSWMTWSPTPDAIAAAYQARSGSDLEHLGWYRGLAAWRFAAITAFNIRLHRSGRRPDPTWELLAEGFHELVDAGHAHARGQGAGLRDRAPGSRSGYC